jgi:phosphoserine aminotransferase
MKRLWNFSAGPAVLPETVLAQAAAEMMDWHGSGMSVMEMSHRGPQFMEILQSALDDFRELLSIPESHKVLFMQGGAIAQNAIVPLNLLKGFNSAAFVKSGSWSGKTIKEFARYGRADVVAEAREIKDDSGVRAANTYVPSIAPGSISPGSAYLHYCSNETIDGVEFKHTPDMHSLGAAHVPLVCDASSNILSRPMDVATHGLIYGGAQKNIGPAGLTFVIIREDQLDRALDVCPSAFHYREVYDNHSMYNTPPTYAIYIAGLVFKWLKNMGGLPVIAEQNRAKAQMLYEAIDGSALYVNRVRHADRSLMNVPFQLREEALNAEFLSLAHERGLTQLKGHKSVGGMRASIYNAMPIEGVQALVDFMLTFEKERA